MEGIEFEDINIKKQRDEDNRIAAAILREANRMFGEWLDAPIMKFHEGSFRNYIPLININAVGVYMIYDEATARYDDISKEIMEKFNEKIVKHHNDLIPMAFSALKEACQTFVNKVENGNARSKKSYAQMKGALDLANQIDINKLK